MSGTVKVMGWNNMNARTQNATCTKAVLSLTAALMCLSLSEVRAEEQADLSDWAPRKGTITYDRDTAVNNGTPSGVHMAKSCKKFQSLFGPNSLLKDGDTVLIAFSQDCHLASMITIKKMVTIASVVGKEAKNRQEMDFIYNQSTDKSSIKHQHRFEDQLEAIDALNQTFGDARTDKERDAIDAKLDHLENVYATQLSQALQQAYGDPIGSSVNRRKTGYGPAFMCQTNAAPCFLIDLPFALNALQGRYVTFIGLRFTAGEGQYAELIQARSGGLILKDNLFEGMRTTVGTDQGDVPDSNYRGPSLVLLQNERAKIEGNTFVGGYSGLSLYPYLAAPSPSFSNAFEISRNILLEQAFIGLDLNGTYRNAIYESRNDWPAVAVDIFGNAVASSAVTGLTVTAVRGSISQNLFVDNWTHIVLSGGEVSINRNILRGAEGSAIDAGNGDKAFINANLFEANAKVITGMASLAGERSPMPNNNICKDQDLDSFIPWDSSPINRRSCGSRKECRAWKALKQSIEASDAATKGKAVDSHILFGRIFYLPAEDEYDRCFNYEAIYGQDARDTLSALQGKDFWGEWGE